MKKMRTYTQLLVERQKLRRQHWDTRDQARNDQVFIPAVANSILAEINAQYQSVCAEIHARGKLVMRENGGGAMVQLVFPFIFECEIDEDEIPF